MEFEELKIEAVRNNLIAENEAIISYDEYINQLPEDDEICIGLTKIRDEEKKHIGELQALLALIDSSERELFEDGESEVNMRKVGARKEANELEFIPYGIDEYGNELSYSRVEDFDVYLWSDDNDPKMCGFSAEIKKDGDIYAEIGPCYDTSFGFGNVSGLSQCVNQIEDFIEEYFSHKISTFEEKNIKLFSCKSASRDFTFAEQEKLQNESIGKLCRNRHKLKGVNDKQGYDAESIFI